MNYFGIIGLVLNVAGALFFIYDTNQLSRIVAGMVNHIAEGYGMFDARKFTKDELSALSVSVKQSKRLTLIGYILFLSGFALQIFGEFFKSI